MRPRRRPVEDLVHLGLKRAVHVASGPIGGIARRQRQLLLLQVGELAKDFAVFRPDVEFDQGTTAPALYDPPRIFTLCEPMPSAIGVTLLVDAMSAIGASEPAAAAKP